MDVLSSKYPYSMDWLINLEGRSYHNFFENGVIYLSLLGLGSVQEILNMSIVDIEECKQIMKKEEMQKLRLSLLGVPVKD